MRAIAVLLVLVFHVFPEWVSGGYIGVDVFFVISGFLICGLIIRETENSRFDVINFYSRRIRRLLPAATLVLVFTAIVTCFLLPKTRWADTGMEIIASSLYVENLFLHFQSINYLTTDKPPSPLQHFWSLSIEEQFYLIWPLLILFALTVVKSSKISLRFFITVILILIFFASLIMSILTSYRDPATAYFVTYNRVWELALGGIIASILPYLTISSKLKLPMSFLGIIMVLGAGLFFTKSTIFPGYLALIPTVGISLLLIAGTIQNSGSGLFDIIQRLLSLKPVIFIGDISYSLYLWHWPLIIFATAAFGSSWLIGILVIIVSVLLAALSKVFVEDPLRNHTFISSIKNAYFLGLFLTLASILSGLFLILAAKSHDQTITDKVIKNPGALAISQPTSEYDLSLIFPTIDMVRNDIPTVYQDQCHSPRDAVKPTPCYYEPVTLADGITEIRKSEELSQDTKKTIVLIGDSHAAHWLPALKEMALKRNYAIVTLTKSSCAFIATDLIIAQKPYKQCFEWGQNAAELIKSLNPDLVVTSMVSNHFAQGSKSTEQNMENLTSGLNKIWLLLNENSIPVAAIKETPRFKTRVPDCIASNIADISLCNKPREEVISKVSPIQQAVNRSKNATLIDMNDHICHANICRVVVGNVFVYRDQHHLTASYARTTSRFLEAKLLPLLNSKR